MEEQKPFPNPFDRYFKVALSLRQVALQLAEFCLPSKLKKHLDLETFQPAQDSYVDERLRESFADVVYDCLLKTHAPVRICFLFEHKSQRPENSLAVQLLRYMLSMIEDDERQKREPGLVVPIVVYHGKEPLIKETIASLYEQAPAAFRRYIPEFDFILIDLSQVDDQALTTRRAGAAQVLLLLLKHARQEAFLRRNFGRIIIFAERKTDAFTFELFYKMTAHYVAVTSPITKKELKAMVIQERFVDEVTWDNILEAHHLQVLYDKEELEQIREQGIEQGIEQGKIESILAVLRKHPEWSDLQIADLLEVSEALVAKVRSEQAL